MGNNVNSQETQAESPEIRAKRARQVERDIAVYWIMAAIQRDRLNKLTPLRG